MPIPAFDSIISALPPHTGDPRLASDLSPFPCTAEELCIRFATSSERRMILGGWLQLRAELRALGMSGFHWMDGSFLEDIENLENRAPGDIDVVTFVSIPAVIAGLDAVFATKPELIDRAHVKKTFHVDHFFVPLGSAPELIVELTRYWYGLFSHRRDQTWKGMLRIELETSTDDDTRATALLGGTP